MERTSLWAEKLTGPQDKITSEIQVSIVKLKLSYAWAIGDIRWIGQV
jgi:hypothetical protein